MLVLRVMEKLAQSLGVTKQQFITLALFAILITSLPVSFYMGRLVFNKPLNKNYQAYRDQSQAPKDASAYSPVTSEKTDLEKQVKEFLSPTPTVEPQPQADQPMAGAASPLSDVSLGPTLNMKISIEGRAKANYQTKAFVGIAQGKPTTKPKYLLSFTVDFPKSGIFNGLSLAGLESGTAYTAYIKGAAQIDSAATFTLKPTVNILSSSSTIALISGDLNEDNIIDASDYTIAKNLYGATPSSSNWNERADLNLDGTVNNIDLLFINKNIGKTGASGVWYSRITTPSSGGAELEEPTQSSVPSLSSGYESSSEASIHSSGYWLWIPPTN